MSANVVPTNYDLLIHPDLTPGDENGGFRGNVVITLDIREPTDVIILHSHLLTIENVNFTSSERDENLVSVGKFIFLKVQVEKCEKFQEFELVTDMEQLKVTLAETVAAGDEYKLEIDFSGMMTGKIVGLYRSTYKDPLGNDR